MIRNWYSNCVIVLLALSTAAFGSIITQVDDWYDDSGGTGYAYGSSQGTSAWSQVNGYMPSGWAGGQGSYGLATTEGAWCDWAWNVYVYAYAEATKVDGYVEAYAYSSASASSPYSASDVPDAEAYVASSGWDAGGNESDSDSGSNWFAAYEGCSASHTGVVAASVASGSKSTASAHACVTASVDLELAF